MPRIIAQGRHDGRRVGHLLTLVVTSIDLLCQSGENLAGRDRLRRAHAPGGIGDRPGVGRPETVGAARRSGPNVNVGKRLVESLKRYVRDSGLIYALLDIRDLERLVGHPAVGAT